MGAALKVPYVDLVAHNAPFREEMLAAVARVLEHGQFILGPEVTEFERRMAVFAGARHVVSCSSGTSALTLAFRALEIGEGDEVLTVSHSFVATATSIRLVGATPVFVDIDARTGLMDVDALEQGVSPRTKAVLVVHLGGIPCDMRRISDFCATHDLRLVEDCAQAIGARFEGRHVGNFGIGCFSLHPLKTLSACGDAGFLTTADEEMAALLRRMRNIGLKSRDLLLEVGENARMDTLQAALLLTKLPALATWIAQRNAHAAAYREALRDGVQHFTPCEGAQPAYSCYAIRVRERDKVLSRLQRSGVDAKIHYPKPIHQHPPFAMPGQRNALPVTERVVGEILSLPVTPEMTEAQRAHVISALADATQDAV